MFTILKDADALDRVRLANPIVKLTLLRNEEAKQLVPLSYLIEHNYNQISN